jgi:hypothetical protein
MDMKVSERRETPSLAEEQDDFLVREGLELLAAYRGIGSEVVRAKVRELVLALADSEVAFN